MRKTITLKSLLMAAALLLGANSVWAQTITSYDFEDGNALFTADSRVSVDVVSGDQTFYNNTFALDGKAVKFTGAGNAQNGYCFAHYDFSSLCDKAAKVKVEFECVLGNGARSRISIGDASVRGTTGNSSKTSYSNKGAIFMLGTEKTVGFINGTNNSGLLTALTQKWLKVTVEVDEAEKKYTYSIVDKATGDVLYNNGEDPIAFWSSDATNCTQIDVFGYINNSTLGLIDNLVITVTKDERQQANYTVNFLDKNSNAIKEAVTRSGAVGDPITLLPADKEAKWNEDYTQKYIYQSDNTEALTIASDGSTVVNIVYRDAEVYSYTVVSNLGATLNTGSGFEGESLRVGYPRYQVDGTDLYMAGVDNKEYRTTVDLTKDNVSKTVNYTLQENKIAAFYTEAENIDGITISALNNIPVRASNALGGVITEDLTITTLPAGLYKLHVGVFTSKSNVTGLHVDFSVGNDIFEAAFTAVNLNEIASGEYMLYKPTEIKYLASSSGDTQFDYIWIEKTGDAAISHEITTDAGWATFVPTADVTVPEGVKAYYVSAISGDKAKLTSTEAIPADAPVLLQAAAGTYTFALCEEAAELTGNLLKVSKGSEGEGLGDYVLYEDAPDYPVGFYIWNGKEGLAAGKVYLPAPAGARGYLSFVFGDATAIKGVESAKENGAVYNLAGQRVAQPTRGLYIVNGKKFVVK